MSLVVPPLLEYRGARDDRIDGWKDGFYWEYYGLISSTGFEKFT